MYKPGDRVRVIMRGIMYETYTDNATIVGFANDEYTVIIDHPDEMAELEGDSVEAKRYFQADDDGVFSDIGPIDDVPQPTMFFDHG